MRYPKLVVSLSLSLSSLVFMGCNPEDLPSAGDSNNADTGIFDINLAQKIEPGVDLTGIWIRVEEAQIEHNYIGDIDEREDSSTQSSFMMFAIEDNAGTLEINFCNDTAISGLIPDNDQYLSDSLLNTPNTGSIEARYTVVDNSEMLIDIPRLEMTDGFEAMDDMESRTTLYYSHEGQGRAIKIANSLDEVADSEFLVNYLELTDTITLENEAFNFQCFLASKDVKSSWGLDGGIDTETRQFIAGAEMTSDPSHKTGLTIQESKLWPFDRSESGDKEPYGVVNTSQYIGLSEYMIAGELVGGESFLNTSEVLEQPELLPEFFADYGATLPIYNTQFTGQLILNDQQLLIDVQPADAQFGTLDLEMSLSF